MTLPDSSQAEITSPVSKKWVWLLIKWTCCALVLGFVAKYAYELWNKDELKHLSLSYGWLLLAGLVYAIGWLPSIWFWRMTMLSLGGDVRFSDTARAYYCGHLGKYIPGKATVLVIRAAMMKDRGSRATAAALTAAYETLLMMGAGLAVAVALSPFTGWPRWMNEWTTSPILPPLTVVVACVLLLPVISLLLTKVATKMTPKEMLPAGETVEISAKLIGMGLLAFVVSWAMNGLSLGLTLRSVSSTPMEFADWPVWTGAVSVATVIGFMMILVPGGVGVRELLLIEVLRTQPHIGAKQAVVAAVLLRLVWVMAEIITATVLYCTVKPPKASPGS